MKHYLAILFFLLFSGCTRWMSVYHPVDYNEPARAIYLKNVSEMLGVPSYSPELKTGDKFLVIEVPGIPFSKDALSFARLSGKDLITIPNEIDKAYLFAQLTNRLLIASKGAQQLSDNGSALSDYYIHKMKGLSETPFNFPPSSLHSATYNNEYFLTVVNPLPLKNDSSWIKVERSLSMMDTLELEEKKVPLLLPAHDFSASISVLRLERPWFDLEYALKEPEGNTNASINRVAYIEEVILARKVKIKNYSKSKAHIVISKEGRKKQVTTEPTELMESEEVVVLGFVYRLL